MIRHWGREKGKEESFIHTQKSVTFCLWQFHFICSACLRKEKAPKKNQTFSGETRRTLEQCRVMRLVLVFQDRSRQALRAQRLKGNKIVHTWNHWEVTILYYHTVQFINIKFLSFNVTFYHFLAKSLTETHFTYMNPDSCETGGKYEKHNGDKKREKDRSQPKDYRRTFQCQRWSL